jgi:hypothetical protein
MRMCADKVEPSAAAGEALLLGVHMPINMSKHQHGTEVHDGRAGGGPR